LRRDRRGDVRQDIENTATILLVKVGSTLRGRILDLSMGGCRIRTEERFPVGIYTRVETEFRAQGLPFRLGGVIQAIHDRNTVGIRFLDLSERKRQQVMELIEEIQQMHAAESPVDPAAA
jgi:c-di-GMP-binding flagellar brake protein YcgR